MNSVNINSRRNILTTTVVCLLTLFLMPCLSGCTVMGHQNGNEGNASLQKLVKGNIDKQDDLLVLVNKEYYLSSDYVPQDLVVPGVKFVKGIGKDENKMRKEAAEALEAMFSAAAEGGIRLYGESGYRSYSTQTFVYNRLKDEKGEEYAGKYSALPGHSEHQTGFTMDITNTAVIDDANDKALGEKKEGIWLRDNAHLYGFILRYPREKTAITGYNYEPWHFRYVGKEAAAEIYNKGQVLEEYFNKLPSQKASN